MNIIDCKIWKMTALLSLLPWRPSAAPWAAAAKLLSIQFVYNGKIPFSDITGHSPIKHTNTRALSTTHPKTKILLNRLRKIKLFTNIKRKKRSNSLSELVFFFDYVLHFNFYMIKFNPINYKEEN